MAKLVEFDTDQEESKKNNSKHRQSFSGKSILKKQVSIKQEDKEIDSMISIHQETLTPIPEDISAKTIVPVTA